MSNGERREKTFLRLRKQLGAAIVDSFFEGASAAARRLPAARPERHGVEVVRDVAYRDSGRAEHLLDVYRPAERDGPLPVVLYGRRFWGEAVNFDALVRWGTVRKEDLKLFRVFDRPQEAFQYLKDELLRHYRRPIGKGVPDSRPVP